MRNGQNKRLSRNIACFRSPRPAYRGWRGIPPSGRKIEKKRPTGKSETKKLKTKTTVLNFGSWNVRTLLDSAKADRPDRRTALVAKELERYNVDIAALSETRFADKGQLTESYSGYTFFWSGRSSEERREAGVGFAIKSQLARKLTKLPEGINDRLMTLQIPLTDKKNATIISAYAPTMTNPDDIKDKFYEELDALISAVPPSEKLILLGDFNARVGTDHETWEGTIGRHGIGKCNSNGLLLLKTCASHDLVITNTLFRLPTRKKTSWMHPRSKHWHLIDYVITRTKDRTDVRTTRAMCGADCWTDHRLIRSKFILKVQPPRRPQKKATAKKLNVAKLHSSTTSDNFSAELAKTLTELKMDESASIDEQWTAFRDTVYPAALAHLGPAPRRNQDWFAEHSEEIETLLAQKHLAFRAHQNDPKSQAKHDAYKTSRNSVQKKLRAMQDNWLSKKADEIQAFADQHNTKHFYDAIKTLYGPQSTGTSPLLSADGTQILTEKGQILERWAEHFDTVLNRPSDVNDQAIDGLPQVVINQDLDTLPTEDEVRKAVKQMSIGKAPGPDAIPAEIYKEGGPAIISKLTELFQSMWHKGEVPQQLKDANVVHIYKRKGNRQSCDNHRGISLLSIAGKILSRVLLNRLLLHLEAGLLPESQCGFRAERGTADMIFAARQLQEKCQEQHSDLYMTFVDLTKAFDTVSREGLWRIMYKFGCPSKFITIVRQLHDGMMVKVMDDGDESDAFPVTNGVKQGCVLAPTLFSMVFSAMLVDAFRDHEDEGFPLRYRTDGELFKPSRLKSVRKSHFTVIRDLLFADDCALNAKTQDQMQHQLDLFSQSCDNFGLTISIKKTEVLFQPAPGKPYIEPDIKIKGETLKAVDRFTYLGSTLSQKANIDIEINSRVAKASASFGRLRKSVWERRGLSLKTKLKVYSAVVLTSLLYGSETWTVYTRHARQLNHFHLTCLRRLLRIKWQEKIPDTEVLERAGQISVQTLLLKSQARWAGHVVRMSDDRLPKQLLYGELKEGKRTVGGQKKRYKDTLKSTLKELKISTDNWEAVASDRPAWRTAVRTGARSAESRRITAAQSKRAARKARAASSADLAPTVPCPTCGRFLRSRAGLAGHMRVHRPRQHSV